MVRRRSCCPFTASATVFQVNYKDTADQAQERFREWLNRGLLKALQMWRAGI